MLVGCPSTLPPPHPVTDTDKCDAAELKLQELQCKDVRGRLIGGPNLSGAPFAETCRTNQQEGGIWMNPKCLSEIKSCKEIDPCLQQQ